MKVALNVRSFENRGGIGRYTRALVQNLIKLYPDDFFSLISNSDTDISFLPPNKNWKFTHIGGPSNRILWERFSLAKAVNDINPDVFHNPDYTIPPGIKVPSVVTVHDLSFKYFPTGVKLKSRMLYNALTPKSVMKARIVIADSKFTKSEIVRAGWKSQDDIRVVYLGVNEIYFDDMPNDELQLVLTQFELEPGYILYLGALDKRKNITAIVKAYSELKNKLKTLPRLVLAGEDIGAASEITSLILQLGLGNDVKRIGFIQPEYLKAIYSAAKIFVFPSYYEGFGLPPLEAMACGVPVITSDRASLPEVVGDAGICISIDSTVGLSESMELLLADENVYADLSEKGKMQAGKFTWPKVAEEVMNVYREVVE